MQTSIILPKKKSIPFIQRLSITKWQYIYYTLAFFNLLTVASSLYLNHRVLSIYTHSIEVNHQWAVQLETSSNLGQLLDAVSDPGHSVFNSKDIELESSRLDSAQETFQQTVNTIRQKLQTQVDLAQAQLLLKDLDTVETTTAAMFAEVQLILSYFRQNQLETAARHMATVDHKYHEVNEALAIFRRDLSQVQYQLLQEERTAADVFRYYEVLLASATLLMVGGVTVYGHHLAQKMKSNDQEKEQSIAELQQAEVRLKAQTQQLQQTLENLQKTQLQLVQNEKMSSLGELVAGVAHEINNPVNFIHGNLTHVRDYSCSLLGLIRLYQKYYPTAVPEIQATAEAIDLDFLQEDLVKLLASLSLGTDRIRQIVLSLRNFSRVDEADFKPVDIHEGIDSTLMILQHRLKARPNYPGITVNKDYGALPQVECYAGQLNQVFMNILSNAIDALEEHNTKRTAAEIQAEPSQIRIRTSVIDNQWVEIAIADNGTGIPEQFQQRIFDPFFTTKPVGKGTGMGMSISYQIITEKHGGRLKCFSTSGKGAEFIIQIPIRQQVREVR